MIPSRLSTTREQQFRVTQPVFKLQELTLPFTNSARINTGNNQKRISVFNNGSPFPNATSKVNSPTN